MSGFLTDDLCRKLLYKHLSVANRVDRYNRARTRLGLHKFVRESEFGMGPGGSTLRFIHEGERAQRFEISAAERRRLASRGYFFGEEEPDYNNPYV